MYLGKRKDTKMKYKIQYYYSASNNSTGYCKEAHGDNMPNDCVPITDEMWQIYEDGIKQGLVIQPAKNGFTMVHPDTLLTEQERIERDKQLLISQANAQIHRDEHLWNNQILWNRYNNEQKTILTNYYDDLIAVTRGESDILPTLTFKGL